MYIQAGEERVMGGSPVAFFVCVCEGAVFLWKCPRLYGVPFKRLKTKSKSSGLPDSNFIFFVATKKTKQKKTRALRWHVCSTAMCDLYLQRTPQRHFCYSAFTRPVAMLLAPGCPPDLR